MDRKLPACRKHRMSRARPLRYTRIRSAWLTLALLSACASSPPARDPKPSSQVERLKEQSEKRQAEEEERRRREDFMGRNAP